MYKLCIGGPTISIDNFEVVAKAAASEQYSQGNKHRYLYRMIHKFKHKVFDDLCHVDCKPRRPQRDIGAVNQPKIMKQIPFREYRSKPWIYVGVGNQIHLIVQKLNIQHRNLIKPKGMRSKSDVLEPHEPLTEPLRNSTPRLALAHRQSD